MIISVLIILAAAFLAYANGANDNFKGVATLFGSGATDYKKALAWATITTFLGSLSAIFISAKLVTAFSGKGFVPEQIAQNPYFLLSVGLGAALTVFIATLSGIPISTTHSLMGALIGAGIIAAGARINFSVLANKFFAPLLISPVFSAVLTFILYPCFKFCRVRLGIERQMCLCAGDKPQAVRISADGSAVLQATGISLTIGQLKNCQAYYQGKILGFDSQAILDKLHYLSSAAVSFSRGLNDTPKIAALLLVIGVFSLKEGIFLVAAAIAIGGILNARKVALTMSRRITRMNHGQGFSANIVTVLLVVFASGLGLPVSTTHVSCGSLFGIGLMNKEANVSVIRQIILAWVITAPLAGILSGLCFLGLRYLG
ncbi:inorganic phosphate transporter [bacterium]|nr:MAG: inorganic phosphate transporter [bacterium]